MGNVLSEEQIEEKQVLIQKLFSLDFPLLDIGKRNGNTGYLDFIKPDELKTNNVVKGIDFCSRPFITFKATIEFQNGEKLKTFTTFFKRYTDNQLIWHCCGNFGENLFNTEGGAKNNQIEMLYQLLKDGEFKLENYDSNDLRLYNPYCWDDDYQTNLDKRACLIRIGEFDKTDSFDEEFVQEQEQEVYCCNKCDEEFDSLKRLSHHEETRCYNPKKINTDNFAGPFAITNHY
jgi:hypothetical protein